jgi:hypothetical protein
MLFSAVSFKSDFDGVYEGVSETELFWIDLLAISYSC